MTGPEFIAAIEALGLTRKAFAEHFGLHLSAVYRWGRERAVPPWVPPVLDLISKDIPHE